MLQRGNCIEGEAQGYVPAKRLRALSQGHVRVRAERARTLQDTRHARITPNYVRTPPVSPVIDIRIFRAEESTEKRRPRFVNNFEIILSSMFLTAVFLERVNTCKIIITSQDLSRFIGVVNLRVTYEMI